MNITVYAIIVTYHSDLKKINHLASLLVNQVDKIILVDNGSNQNFVNAIKNDYENNSKYELIFLEANMGLAKAQNFGIEHARKDKSHYVILFDHDSQPCNHMVETLVRVAEEKSKSGKKIGAVGPRFIDERQKNTSSFVKTAGFKLIKEPCKDTSMIIEADYLIASGSLIPMKTLDAVGDMLDELFIDYVDIEWGLRARNKGFQSFGVCAAEMEHDLGDEPIEFLGKKYPNHSPLRHYYHFRNAVWLYRQTWVPSNWKYPDGWRLVLKYIFYSMFASPQYKHFWMMTKGICHGFIGRMGKLD